VLVEAGVLTVKSEQKKNIANIVTLNFENFPKVIVQDRLTLIPKGKKEVINPLAEKQEAKSLIPLIFKSGEIMWVHLDIINDER